MHLYLELYYIIEERRCWYGYTGCIAVAFYTGRIVRSNADPLLHGYSNCAVVCSSFLFFSFLQYLGKVILRDCGLCWMACLYVLNCTKPCPLFYLLFMVLVVKYSNVVEFISLK